MTGNISTREAETDGSLELAGQSDMLGQREAPPHRPQWVHLRNDAEVVFWLAHACSHLHTHTHKSQSMEGGGIETV